VISRITWDGGPCGCSVGRPPQDEEDFLHQFSIVELDERVARDAIGLRQERRLKLPDEIVWASAT